MSLMQVPLRRVCANARPSFRDHTAANEVRILMRTLQPND